MTLAQAIPILLEWGTFGGVVIIGVILFFVERRLLAVETQLEADSE